MEKPKKLKKVQKTVNGKTRTVTLKPSSINEALKYGGAKRKYDDGGVTRKDIKNAKREAKLKRIQSGTEPSTYEKVANITSNVANTAASAAQVANAVRDARSGAGAPGIKEKGGSVKKYKTGGMTNSNAKASVTKRATGKTGGISKAPKTAVPKAKYGMSMRKK